jgi:hypothetical protein
MQLPCLPAGRHRVRQWRSLARATAAAAVLGTLFLATASGTACGDEPAEAADRHPELRRLSDTDEIWLDKAGGRVVVGGEIAMAEGAIEVFACPRQTKEHEAVVATRCPARLVHAGLLAIGLEPGHPVSFDPDYEPAEGPGVKVLVRWHDADGNQRERPAQELIRNTKTGGQLEAEWVFAGSSFWVDPADGTRHYQADGGDMICVSNFPSAMLDLPIASSESNAALLFEAFPERVPPPGTVVDLILSAAP